MACFKPDIRLADLHDYHDGMKSRTLKFIRGNAKNFAGYEFFEEQNRIFRELGEEKEFQKVPCGDCAGCQEAYSKDWAIRCMFEASNYKENYFITLTYDDDHIPLPSEIVDKRTGEIYENDGSWESGSLCEEDLTKFIKDLRRHWEYHYHHTGIRFFACGEYGGQTQRPHYHLVIFNLPIKTKNLKVYKMTKDTVLWECKEIANIWKKGFITVAEVNWDTCAYTARYVMKKQKGKIPREIYFELGREPEFIRMSRMPGIGLAYFNTNYKDIYSNDEIIIKGHKEKITPCKPPKYYDAKYDIINHDRLKQIKEERKTIAKRVCDAKNAQSTLPEAERLKIEERTKLCKWNSLKRDAI